MEEKGRVHWLMFRDKSGIKENVLSVLKRQNKWTNKTETTHRYREHVDGCKTGVGGGCGWKGRRD